jgi:transposase
MYITSVPNRDSPPAILLRHSVREGKKVRTITLANLSKWKPQRIEAVKRALKGEFDGLTNVTPTCGKIFGLLFVLKTVADRIGITRALKKTKLSGLILFLVLARIAHQGSRLSAVRWSKDHAVKEILNVDEFDEDDLYEALDEAAEQQEAIESSLYQSYLKSAKKPTNLVLYDVTSSYFEGTHNELAEYGYNRDGKKGKKQIVIGLLASEDGEPLAVRVFKGNTSDCTTVADQIEIIKNQYKINEVIFVGDRGMIKAKGKKALTDEEFKYITALTNPQLRKLIGKDVIQLNMFDKEICEVEHDNKRLILRKNDEVESAKKKTRERNLEKLKTLIEERNKFVASSKRAKPKSGLTNLQDWTKRRNMNKWIKLTLEDKEIIYELDQDGLEQTALLDGCYVMETNIEKSLLSSKNIDKTYRSLQQVERNFRNFKTSCLEVRPIFLRKSDRTKGHVLIAMLSLKITRYIEKRLHDKFGTTNDEPHNPTLEDVLGALSRIIFLNYDIAGQEVSRLSRPDKSQRKILTTLGINFGEQKK